MGFSCFDDLISKASEAATGKVKTAKQAFD
jgi:hypothetical protein